MCNLGWPETHDPHDSTYFRNPTNVSHHNWQAHALCMHIYMWAAWFSFSVRDFSLSNCILFCCVWLLFPGGMLSSDGRWRESGSW